jgi:hypothetical protein
MAAITYYVALPVLKNEEGEWVAGQALEAKTPEEAKRRAMALAAVDGGAVAFSRTGDPDTGEFSDAVILARFGEVPDDLTELMG